MIYGVYISGGWYTYPSEKYEFVSWDDSSQLNGNRIHMFRTTNQHIVYMGFISTVNGSVPEDFSAGIRRSTLRIPVLWAEL